MVERIPQRNVPFLVGGVFAVALGCLVLAKSVEPGESLRHEQRPVVVEALGFCALDAGKTTAEAHREALLDARRNAVIQAHVFLRVETRVENMQLRERILYSRATGYVEEVHVWEAGVMPDTDPPLYRVRVRAVVRGTEAPEAAATLQAGGAEPWRPLVELRVTSNLARQREDDLRRALSHAMNDCGIRIVQPHQERPCLVAQVAVAAGASPEDVPLRVDWEMRLGESGPEETPGGDPVRGQWVVTDAGFRTSGRWERLGTRLAQEAIRLWATPRVTVIAFRDAGADQAQRIRDAFGEGAQVLADEEQVPSEVRVRLTMAGDPLQSVEPLLEKSGLADEVELVEPSLTRIVYRFTSTKDLKSRQSATAKAEKGA